VVTLQCSNRKVTIRYYERKLALSYNSLTAVQNDHQLSVGTTQRISKENYEVAVSAKGGKKA